ncbi:glutaredoxin family protein [Brevibacillus ruminantium]|uniref:Glutaredoxin family protein n=1 Tax=Brevibacillus ruminantium TaxID=2950604 RepID=A0ABY4WEF8_9BACL|nr:glutaredoxin family protein [Brevibacillus ruminantium]USG65236.1 glutaredoxin family protein [Brevibacillus ruminantium]
MNRKPFHIVLYGRPGCHLCDQVEAVLQVLGEEFPLELRLVNIEQDPALHERYLFVIPVVEIDGEEVFPSVTHVVTMEELWNELDRRSRQG